MKRNKTASILLLVVVLALLFMSTASTAAHSNSTATPTVSGSITPTPNATATPVPTPAPRQVFSSPRWDTDHVTITVVNAGDPITVIAWIDNTSKKTSVSVGAGETVVVSTPSIKDPQNGQIIKFGFDALQNTTTIDSYSATITVNLGPTPTVVPAETITITGTIVDADKGTPISGAMVTFRSITYDKTYPAVTTASDGTYTSSKMYPDMYTIKITMSGYQAAALTTDKVVRDSQVDSIGIKRLAGTPTATVSPTPGNPVDSWVSLLYNPALCVGTISSLIAVIVGSIGIYDWMERRRRQRQDEGKKDKFPPGMKKP
jgi:Carboxypeptidase regulatory-like domain